MEIGKIRRDTTTIPDNSNTKRGYMRGEAYIYMYIHIQNLHIDRVLDCKIDRNIDR